MLNSRRDELPDKAAAAVDLIVADVGRFQNLVEDLLEISRFDAGAVRLNLEDLQVAEFVRQAVSVSSLPEAQLEVDPRAEDLVIQADNRRLARVVANLLENARYYGGGEVTVTVEPSQPEGEEIQEVQIAVEDHGPGVPPEERLLIFERFAAASRRDGGAAARARASAWRWSTSTSGSTAAASGWTTAATAKRVLASSSSSRRRGVTAATGRPSDRRSGGLGLGGRAGRRGSAGRGMRAADGQPPRDVPPSSRWSHAVVHDRAGGAVGHRTARLLRTGPADQPGTLVPVTRQVEPTGVAAIQSLFDGLTVAEQSRACAPPSRRAPSSSTPASYPTARPGWTSTTPCSAPVGTPRPRPSPRSSSPPPASPGWHRPSCW